MIGGWTCSRPPRPLPRPSSATAPTSPTATSGTSPHIFPDWEPGRRPTTSSRRKIGAYAALQGTLGAGRRPAARRDAAVRRHRPAHLQGLVLRGAEVRRGSARQPDQRAGASRSRSCSPRPSQAQRLVQSGAAGDSAADGPAVDERRRRRSRCTASRSRISTASRSTSSTKRASTCCRWRAASRRRPTTPTRRSRPPTSSTRRSSCRPARR